MSDELHDTIIHRYGLLAPLDWDEGAREQLWLKNRLWNALVEIERETRARYREIVGAHDTVAPLEREIAALDERAGALREERKRLKAGEGVRRNAERIRGITDALREIARERQPLAERARESRKAARADVAEPLAALEAERAARATAARNSAGLWWPNANAVVDAYDKARRRAMRDGAELRFHRFDGGGSFVVQLIGGRPVESLSGGTCSQVRIGSPQPVPGRGGKARPVLTIAIAALGGEDGRSFRTLSFPLILHRPLPAAATVQDVTVTRRRVGTRFEHHVVFRCRVPAQEFVASESARRCGINLGFRERPGGTLRIGMLIDETGRTRELTLPAGIPQVLDRVQAVRSARDTHLEAIVARLRAAWPDRPQPVPDVLGERLTAILRAPRIAAARLAALTLRWRDDPDAQPYWPAMLGELEAWRRTDKHHYEREANERAQILAQRREGYRRLARQIAQTYGEVRIGEIDLRGLARLERPDGQETELAARARSNRNRAALYELQQELSQQAVKSGSTLIRVSPPYSTVCPECGKSVATGADLMVSCADGHVWDQDELAARNILAAPRERWSDAQGPEERSQQRIQALTRMRERLARMQAARRAKRSQRSAQRADSGGV